MGIESLSGVTGAASYQGQTSQIAKPVTQVSAASTETNKGNEVVVETAKSSTSNVAVSIGQAGDSEQSSNFYNEEAAKQSAEKKASSMGEVKDINKLINNNTVAEFSYNEPTKRIAIKIKDKNTDEVIKEIPSEKALEMLAKAWELAGILVDEKR